MPKFVLLHPESDGYMYAHSQDERDALVDDGEVIDVTGCLDHERRAAMQLGEFNENANTDGEADSILTEAAKGPVHLGEGVAIVSGDLLRDYITDLIAYGDRASRDAEAPVHGSAKGPGNPEADELSPRGPEAQPQQGLRADLVIRDELTEADRRFGQPHFGHSRDLHQERADHEGISREEAKRRNHEEAWDARAGGFQGNVGWDEELERKREDFVEGIERSAHYTPAPGVESEGGEP